MIQRECARRPDERLQSRLASLSAHLGWDATVGAKKKTVK